MPDLPLEIATNICIASDVDSKSTAKSAPPATPSSVSLGVLWLVKLIQ